MTDYELDPPIPTAKLAESPLRLRRRWEKAGHTHEGRPCRALRLLDEKNNSVVAWVVPGEPVRYVTSYGPNDTRAIFGTLAHVFRLTSITSDQGAVFGVDDRFE